MTAPPPAASGSDRPLRIESYGRAAETHPPLGFADYRSTGLRAPKQPLVLLPHLLTEVTGPLFGADRVLDGDADLTICRDGEALGQRIVVHGRVLDSGGRPGPDTLVEGWQGEPAGRPPGRRGPSAGAP